MAEDRAAGVTSIAVPLSLAISIGSIFFGAGGAYVTVTTTSARLQAVEARVDDHVHAPAHTVAGARMNEHDRRLDELSKLVQAQASTHDDILKISSNVRALCQASRAANCAP